MRDKDPQAERQLKGCLVILACIGCCAAWLGYNLYEYHTPGSGPLVQDVNPTGRAGPPQFQYDIKACRDEAQKILRIDRLAAQTDKQELELAIFTILSDLSQRYQQTPESIHLHASLIATATRPPIRESEALGIMFNRRKANQPWEEVIKP